MYSFRVASYRLRVAGDIKIKKPLQVIIVRISNVEQGISNDEVWNRPALSFYIIKMIEYLTSTFIIPCSIFCGSNTLQNCRSRKKIHRWLSRKFHIQGAVVFQGRGNTCSMPSS
jgi:hypothetical protein